MIFVLFLVDLEKPFLMLIQNHLRWVLDSWMCCVSLLVIVFMDRISNHSQCWRRVQYGRSGQQAIAFSEGDFLAPRLLALKHTCECFYAECEAAVVKISTFKSKPTVFSQKRVGCAIQVKGEALPLVEELIWDSKKEKKKRMRD